MTPQHINYIPVLSYMVSLSHFISFGTVAVKPSTSPTELAPPKQQASRTKLSPTTKKAVKICIFSLWTWIKHKIKIYCFIASNFAECAPSQQNCVMPLFQIAPPNYIFQLDVFDYFCTFYSYCLV